MKRTHSDPKCVIDQIHMWSGRQSDSKPCWSANLTSLLLQKQLFWKMANCNQMIFSSMLLHLDCYFSSLFRFVEILLIKNFTQSLYTLLEPFINLSVEKRTSFRLYNPTNKSLLHIWNTGYFRMLVHENEFGA